MSGTVQTKIGNYELFVSVPWQAKKGKRRVKASVENADDEEEDTEDAKKGEKKQVYGVRNHKWYARSSSKEAIEALKLAGQVEAYEDREEIFDQNRAGLLYRYRNEFSFQCFFWFLQK